MTDNQGRKLPERRITGARGATSQYDLVCFSHLRWDFVHQRPQHLLSRCARERRVFFFEEPIISEGRPRLDVRFREAGVWVVVPQLPAGLDEGAAEQAQRALVDEMLRAYSVHAYVLWLYSPMALGVARDLEPVATVYDCMDELSGFLGAPPSLRARERELFQRADLVFTGGRSLYEAKRGQHRAVHCFPSSIEAQHFARARELQADPDDQAEVARPRLGYFGVIDERIDLELLAGLADARPNWQIVMLGPVVKIDPASLPRRPNIHYLGQKPYAELPAYIAGWDLAIMPFARNDATRFISPTKTPEYLAAGRPVVSTSIRDVVRPYGIERLVAIADDPETFVAAAERQLGRDDRERRHWLARVDAFLAGNSWDSTWARMRDLIDAACMQEMQEHQCSTT
jgi:UDP-galactopyranose mutase